MWLALEGVARWGITIFAQRRDRKSTRLNSSHDQISYAVFCLKKKKKSLLRPAADATRIERLRRQQLPVHAVEDRHGEEQQPALLRAARVGLLSTLQGHLPVG